ncbi:MAG: hypothetical protein ABW130_13220, partial [Candidatus Thiodiazotropha lotti]
MNLCESGRLGLIGIVSVSVSSPSPSLLLNPPNHRHPNECPLLSGKSQCVCVYSKPIWWGMAPPYTLKSMVGWGHAPPNRI